MHTDHDPCFLFTYDQGCSLYLQSYGSTYVSKWPKKLISSHSLVFPQCLSSSQNPRNCNNKVSPSSSATTIILGYRLHRHHISTRAEPYISDATIPFSIFEPNTTNTDTDGAD
ncbi:hypothetical protein L2E82_44808 [Cichorium intybus]|uniref:Uncharacterized protein n=1 Tax=Cichorium intybus TaxID=13427 RepID=A0ACB8ZQU4_CICIN|nr:hypothetical protein L2E82_44808 [Cichorium intybus]